MVDHWYFSMNLEGAELETVSAQLSKELEQMTLPVLERLETATSEGEVFDNREIKVGRVYCSLSFGATASLGESSAIPHFLGYKMEVYSFITILKF